MCLVTFAYRRHDRFPLVLAGNRDEFHARPTLAARWWSDEPDIVGGRDLVAGGTWLALSKNGRFATVTNYRDKDHEPGNFESRGTLVTGFLNSDLGATDYLDAIEGDAYAGFNLLLFDGEELGYMSNRGAEPTALAPGIYGLSNATLDTPWHKVKTSKAALEGLLESDQVNESTLLRLLDDRDKGPAAEVETGRLDFPTAHALTAPFIVMPDYGTRSSTIVTLDAEGEVLFVERRFDAEGTLSGESRYTFSLSGQAG